MPPELSLPGRFYGTNPRGPLFSISAPLTSNAIEFDLIIRVYSTFICGQEKHGSEEPSCRFAKRTGIARARHTGFAVLTTDTPEDEHDLEKLIFTERTQDILYFQS